MKTRSFTNGSPASLGKRVSNIQPKRRRRFPSEESDDGLQCYGSEMTDDAIMACMAATPHRRKRHCPETSSLSAGGSSPPCRLLDLPPELLVVILEYVLISRYGENSSTVAINSDCQCISVSGRELHSADQTCWALSLSKARRRCLGVLATSRTLYHYSREILYSRTSFFFTYSRLPNLHTGKATGVSPASPAIKMVARHGAEHVRSIQVLVLGESFFQPGRLAKQIGDFKNALPQLECVTLWFTTTASYSAPMQDGENGPPLEWNLDAVNDPALHRACGKRLIFATSSRMHRVQKWTFDLERLLSGPDPGALGALLYAMANHLLSIMGYLEASSQGPDGDKQLSHR
ncbi:hypothetical protein BROUX41_002193 [Berkeleyomyces rouxiae]